MKKIILDTNIIISALISDSYPFKILYEIVFAGKVKICLSKEIFGEYMNVLNRDKFSKIPNFKINSEIVLQKLSDISVFFEVTEQLDILSDKDDNKFLELALQCSANYIVTGNFKDFGFENFHKTKIVSPKDFYLQFK